MKSLPSVIPGGFMATDLRRPAGVYLLYRGETVVYVGQGRNVFARIVAHRQRFDFDYAIWMPIATKQSRYAHEGALVRRFNPEFTVRCNANEGKDAEILKALSLDPDPGARLAFLHRLKSHNQNRANSARLMWQDDGFRKRWSEGKRRALQRRKATAA